MKGKFIVFEGIDGSGKTTQINQLSKWLISTDLIPENNKYQIEKFALEKANEQLFYLGINTTIVRFGPFDSPRIAHKKQKKMSIDYCCSVIKWILEQPHRIKDITESIVKLIPTLIEKKIDIFSSKVNENLNGI